jgi:hypothetical protein
MTVLTEGKGLATITEPDGSSTEDIEVTIDAIANNMVLLRRKGKSQIEMLMADVITSFETVESAAKNGTAKIKQRALLPLDAAKARRHLLDYHSVSLSWINENSPETALEYHETLDHSDLGHNHEKVEKEEAAEEEAA